MFLFQILTMASMICPCQFHHLLRPEPQPQTPSLPSGSDSYPSPLPLSTCFIRDSSFFSDGVLGMQPRASQVLHEHVPPQLYPWPPDSISFFEMLCV